MMLNHITCMIYVISYIMECRMIWETSICDRLNSVRRPLSACLGVEGGARILHDITHCIMQHRHTLYHAIPVLHDITHCIMQYRITLDIFAW
jgi:hypothetical protein